MKSELRKISVMGLFVILLAGLSHAYAGDAEAGKKTAATCVACHGPVGISMTPIWPNLAGQKRDYLIKQLRAFVADTRKDPIMSPVAKTLSEHDIENVSEYFSNLKSGK